MLEHEITISNRLGLHARASAKLVQALHEFQAATVIAYRGKEVNAKSIMGVMMLAAGLGATIRVRADGPDEEAAMAAMVDLFERKFDEGK
ncbi:MAG TPA: HPr family phosphocarrier protein [Rhodanobacteraceae bacterium]|jgi:phosphocarrier protein|nr:HPr family phosphocarrier protein [Rhodanobacteraceae bacterium]